MASFLTSSDIAFRTGQLGRHFDTFSQGRNLVIFKEPLQTIVNNSENVYAGYGNESSSTVVLTPVSGVYPAMAVYNKNISVTQQPPIQTVSAASTTRIKVKEDARQFINNGKNESFIFDGMTFNQIGEESVQNYLGLIFYYYTLKRTN